MRADLLDHLLETRRTGKPTALATHLPSGRQALIDGGTVTGDLNLSAETLAALESAIAEDRSQVVETAEGAVFVEVWNPPLRLIAVGAVHIAQHLAAMAALAGYRVTIIDPRGAFATEERFPDVEIISDWPDEVLPGLSPDKRTAIVTLTHDPKIDDPALQAALRSGAFYIGALGSRRTHAKRTDRLKEAGFDETAIARIHGPVGLDIGALSQGEIAVSILAEITAVLRAGRIKAKA
jgi:xanthine dehydrogenase accessory factor